MNIWVFAQEANGAPTSATLELVSKARTLGTVTAFVGGDASAIATEHTNVDTLTRTVSAATVEIGTRAARLEEAKVRAEDNQMLLTQQLSEVEDVDIVEALIKAKAQESSYQATLQVAAKILPPSLLDYLR